MSDLNQLYQKLMNKGEGMPLSVAICNDKGGSAKTTTAINLAEALARIDFNENVNAEEPLNLKVLLIDGDDSRTCSIWARKREQGTDKGNFLVCNEKEAVSIIIRHRPNLLVYDTAGGIKTHEMAELGEICNFFILPCKPDFFNSVGTFIMAEWLIEKNKQFRILISDTPVAGNYARGNEIKEMLRGAGKPFFEQFIKSSVKVTDANNFGKTVFDMSGARELADAFTKVAIETLEMIADDKVEEITEQDFGCISDSEINEALTAGIKR